MFYHHCEVDVPIPLVYEVDSATRLRLPHGELFAQLRGEAYDRRYSLEVDIRLPDAAAPFGYRTSKMVAWSQNVAGAGRNLWIAGWQVADEAGLTLSKSDDRLHLIQSLFAPVFAADIAIMTRQGAGEVW